LGRSLLIDRAMRMAKTIVTTIASALEMTLS